MTHKVARSITHTATDKTFMRAQAFKFTESMTSSEALSRTLMAVVRKLSSARGSCCGRTGDRYACKAIDQLVCFFFDKTFQLHFLSYCKPWFRRRWWNCLCESIAEHTIARVRTVIDRWYALLSCEIRIAFVLAFNYIGIYSYNILRSVCGENGSFRRHRRGIQTLIIARHSAHWTHQSPINGFQSWNEYILLQIYGSARHASRRCSDAIIVCITVKPARRFDKSVHDGWINCVCVLPRTRARTSSNV